MKQLNRFVTCTEPFAVGQAQGAALWGQECHHSPAQEVWRARLQHPSPGIDGSCTISASPVGTGAGAGVLHTNFSQTPSFLDGFPSPVGAWFSNH